MSDIKKICIFEDDRFADLYPLTLTRPVFELFCGILSLADRWRSCFPGAKVTFRFRPGLQPVFSGLETAASDEMLWVNGAVIPDQDLLEAIETSADETLVCGDRVLAYRNKAGKKTRNIDARIVTYPWDPVSWNDALIRSDFDSMNRGGQVRGKLHEGVILVNPDAVFIDEGSVIKPGTVIDAEHGPVFVGRDVEIQPNSVLEGPCYVGDGSRIKAGARIYEGSRIGNRCKVGGEVEASIMHGLSNKQHDGFLGHSYIGEWCNLGADTNTSDLKNNYGTVKVTVNGKSVNTGSRFVGLMMGDHAKSGINTMFNTGTVVGVSANVFGGDFPPKFIPSFAWGGAAGFGEYDLQKALETARTVMQRRRITMTPEYESMLKDVFKSTQAERRSIS